MHGAISGGAIANNELENWGGLAALDLGVGALEQSALGVVDVYSGHTPSVPEERQIYSHRDTCLTPRSWTWGVGSRWRRHLFIFGRVQRLRARVRRCSVAQRPSTRLELAKLCGWGLLGEEGERER
jgi:hypothetical protein